MPDANRIAYEAWLRTVGKYSTTRTVGGEDYAFAPAAVGWRVWQMLPNQSAPKQEWRVPIQRWALDKLAPGMFKRGGDYGAYVKHHDYEAAMQRAAAEIDRLQALVGKMFPTCPFCQPSKGSLTNCDMDEDETR